MSFKHISLNTRCFELCRVAVRERMFPIGTNRCDNNDAATVVRDDLHTWAKDEVVRCAKLEMWLLISPSAL